MLTDAQKQTLKAAILADPALAAHPNNSDGAFAIAEALNQLASPDFIVWRSKLPLEEVTALDGFAWNLVDSLTVGQARIWEWLFDNPERAINASKSNVRAGVANVWSGTTPKTAVQTAIIAVAKRKATRAEKLLASGTGSDGSPAVMGFEGALSYSDVQEARNS